MTEIQQQILKILFESPNYSGDKQGIAMYIALWRCGDSYKWGRYNGAISYAGRALEEQGLIGFLPPIGENHPIRYYLTDEGIEEAGKIK